MDRSPSSTVDRLPTSAVDGFESAWVSASRIEGWLSKEQGAVLYDAARSVPDDTWIVEIGSHHGRSTTLLASAKPTSASFLAIDPFPDPPWGGGEPAYQALCDNLDRAGLSDEVHILRATSEEAAAAAPMVFEVASEDQSRAPGLRLPRSTAARLRCRTPIRRRPA
jgi:predicted O-methyltransferase YrrM